MKFPKITLKPRERLLAVCAGLVLMVIVLDRAVIHPWLVHGRKVRQDTKQMETALHAYARLLERKDGVLSRRERYQRCFRPEIAEDLQKAAFINEIEELAGEAEVVLGDIKSSEIEGESTIKQFVFDVQFECSLEQWVDFIYEVETSASLYEIARAGLSMPEEGADRLEGYVRLVSAVPSSAAMESHEDALN